MNDSDRSPLLSGGWHTRPIPLLINFFVMTVCFRRVAARAAARTRRRWSSRTDGAVDAQH
jgi:hypothetical protein